MIDPHTVIRDYLLLDADLVGLVGNRVYAGRDVPPVGYAPGDGPCVTFRVRGGEPDYDDALLNPSVQFKCYAPDEPSSYEVYRALYDHLHNGQAAGIAHAESEVLGQLLEEPETDWHFVLAYFRVMLRKSS